MRRFPEQDFAHVLVNLRLPDGREYGASVAMSSLERQASKFDLAQFKVMNLMQSLDTALAPLVIPATVREQIEAAVTAALD